MAQPVIPMVPAGFDLGAPPPLPPVPPPPPQPQQPPVLLPAQSLGRGGGKALDESELSISIPLKSIYEYFLCPVCLNEVTDGHMTGCGHIFCESCIKECLNRRHVCPLCNAATTVDKLVKNHHFDSLLRTFPPCSLIGVLWTHFLIHVSCCLTSLPIPLSHRNCKRTERSEC